ncbi:transposase [Syntrophomonas erecta]
MTNHVHLLLRENDEDISVFMKRLGVSYAYWYNCRYERTGHVFQDRFKNKSECVEDDAYLLAVIGYIHQNSIKTSITSNPEEYEWGSCADYCKADRNTTTFPTFSDTNLILGILHKEKIKAVEQLKKFTEEDNKDRCLDCDETKRISESEAYEITKKIMKGKTVTVLQ